MTKRKMYRYIGRNGIITSPVLLNDYPKIDMYELIADTGKVLTNGEKMAKNIVIEADELELWTEVTGQK